MAHVALRPRLAAVALLAALCLSGCHDARSIEERAFITLLGIDHRTDGEPGFLVTATMPLPRAAQSGGGGGVGASGPLSPNYTFAAQGRSLGEAMERLPLRIDREVDWGHLRFIVIGREALAREGLVEILDPPVREPRIASDIIVMVAWDDSAAATISTIPPIEQFAHVYYLFYFLKENEAISTDPVLLWEAYSWLYNPGVEPFLPIVSLGDQPDVLEISGLVLLKGEWPVGILRGEEAKYFLWARGRLDAGYVVASLPDEPGSISVVRVTGVDTSTEATWDGPVPRIRVKLRIEGEVRSATVIRFAITHQDYLRALERRSAEIVRTEVAAVIEKVQKEYQTDVFGWGERLRARYPRRWSPEMWEHLFPQAEITVDVQMDIRLRGAIW